MRIAGMGTGDVGLMRAAWFADRRTDAAGIGGAGRARTTAGR